MALESSGGMRLTLKAAGRGVPGGLIGNYRSTSTGLAGAHTVTLMMRVCNHADRPTDPLHTDPATPCHCASALLNPEAA